VVLDFWIKPKPFTMPVEEARVDGYVLAASNEGSPPAVKLHGTGAKDMFHFELDGKHDGATNDACW
jgi:hypothetical protein